MTPGRPPTTQPATAYERRRYIALVQVLATSSSDQAIRELCELWDVEVVPDKSVPPYRGQDYMNVWATIRKLAQHVIEYHRDAEAGE